MNSRNILIGSLIANLGLAGAAYCVFKKQDAPLPASSSLPSNASTANNEEAASSTSAREIQSTNASESGKKFAWQALQSKDLRAYIDNLRLVGCPEETIRDIITAEVNKLYAKRIRDIRQADRQQYSYWETDRRRGNVRKDFEQRKQFRALEKEKSALLVELLGVDPNEDIKKENNYVDYWTRNFQFLPEGKRDQVEEIQAKFSEMEQDIYANNKGVMDAEEQQKIREIAKQRRAELATILTPDELKEYDLRASQTSGQLRWELSAFNPTEDEFRKIFAIRNAREDDLAYNYDPDDKEAEKRRSVAQKETNDEIKQLLGDDRYKLYERAPDYNYRELVRLVERQDLPRENADKVYDMKKEAEDMATKIRSNSDYTQAQKNDMLKQLRDETQKGVTEALGDTGWNKYKDRYGWWLNNLSPRSKQ